MKFHNFGTKTINTHLLDDVEACEFVYDCIHEDYEFNLNAEHYKNISFIFHTDLFTKSEKMIAIYRNMENIDAFSILIGCVFNKVCEEIQIHPEYKVGDIVKIWEGPMHSPEQMGFYHIFYDKKNNMKSLRADHNGFAIYDKSTAVTVYEMPKDQIDMVNDSIRKYFCDNREYISQRRSFINMY
jgi:hypothetical protein